MPSAQVVQQKPFFAPMSELPAVGIKTAAAVKSQVYRLPEIPADIPSERKADALNIGSLNVDADRECYFELIPGKLGFAFHRDDEQTISEIKRRPDLYYFSTDLHERYTPFAKDFGPVCLTAIHRFSECVTEKANNPRLGKRPLIYYADLDEKHQANAAVLLGGHMMLEFKMTTAAIIKAFAQIPNYPFIAFRDATHSVSDFGLSLEHVLQGLEKAIQVGLYSRATFDADLCEQLQDPNGDVSQIGDKFVALRGPRMSATADDWACPPSFYVPIFKHLGVKAVVRLNESETYDKAEFESHGITVHDLHFADCTCPPTSLIKKFLDLVERTEGKIAVHCKAGLGRTGTVIALWLMKTLAFSAREAIAFLRLNRPGCVIGNQQHFLADCEHARWEGNTLLPFSVASSVASSVSRRSSSTASGASTPVRGSVKSVTFCASIPQAVEAKVNASARELGRQIERTSRERSRLLRAGA